MGHFTPVTSVAQVYYSLTQGTQITGIVPEAPKPRFTSAVYNNNVPTGMEKTAQQLKEE
jgi:hypothetical protein